MRTSWTWKQWTLLAFAALVIVALLAVVGLNLAARSLRSHLEQALGPHGTVGALHVRLTTVEASDIVVRAPKGWPAADLLHAKRIVLHPKWQQLLKGSIHIDTATLEGAYLSVYRPREGQLRVLPGLVDKAARPQSGESTTGVIDRLTLTDCTIEFFDASVDKPPHPIRLTKVEGEVTGLVLPQLSSRTTLKLKAAVPGRTTGSMLLDGWLEEAQGNSDLTLKLDNIDLAVVDPYLLTAAKLATAGGTLDLDWHPQSQHHRLHAPGVLTLNQLALKSPDSLTGALASLPRRVVVAGLADDDKKIVLNFTLDGDTDNLKFALNENIALLTGTALAKDFGINVEGLVRAISAFFGAFTGVHATAHDAR